MQIPIGVKKSIQNLYEKFREGYLVEKSDDFLMRLIPHEIQSEYGFYFTIIKYYVLNENVVYDCEWMPKNEMSFASNKMTGVNEESVIRKVHVWNRIINEYKKSMPFFEDTIIEFYKKEISNDFKLIDDDANSAPYDSIVQDEIRKRLDYVIETVEQQPKNDPKLETEANEIIEVATKLKSGLHRMTKNQVFDKLKDLAARGKKFSPELGKELIKALFIEGLKLAYNLLTS